MTALLIAAEALTLLVGPGQHRRAEGEAPMTSDNLVRACPRHRVILLERKRGEGLWCPAGRHDVKRWLVVDRSKCRALYEASAEKGAERMAEEKVKVDEHQAKTVTIERQKFQDATGASLFIRLSREPKKWGGDPFRIRWTHVPPGSVQSRKGTTGGVSKTTAAELDGIQGCCGRSRAARLEAGFHLGRTSRARAATDPAPEEARRLTWG